ncbi:MAG: hypothetical protein OEM02_10510, partial [Desulfobulbaceae bacterium]|nr:hypothetical protein [Desulfobulbaceae bacterium]
MIQGKADRLRANTCFAINCGLSYINLFKKQDYVKSDPNYTINMTQLMKKILFFLILSMVPSRLLADQDWVLVLSESEKEVANYYAFDTTNFKNPYQYCKIVCSVYADDSMGTTTARRIYLVENYEEADLCVNFVKSYKYAEVNCVK